MKSYRRQSDCVVDSKNVSNDSKGKNLKDKYANQSKSASLSVSKYDNVPAAIDFPELKLIVSDSVPSKLVTQKEELADNPLYYTGNLEEGFGNTEVVTENDSQTDIHNDGEKFYTATPVETFDLLSHIHYEDKVSLNVQSFSTGQQRKPRVTSDILKALDIINSNDPYTSNESESDVEFFTLLSDDDTHLSFMPTDSESDDQDEGNLPNFDKLDVAVSIEINISSPPNALVSERIPTATVAYISEPSSPETPVTLTSKSPAPETRQKEKPSHLVTKPNTRSDSESSASTFCSTKVQSALLSKLTVIEPSDLSTVPSFTSPESSLSSGRKSKSSIKLKSSKRMKTGLGKVRFDKDVERDLQIFESEVGQAFKASVDEGSVMPLLKQELQYMIQVRRLSRGDSELILEPEEPKDYELTPEEIEKKSSRLEQNRRSADRSRKKAKQHEKKLQETIKKEMIEHSRLTKEMAIMKKVRDTLRSAYDEHMDSCKKALED